MKEGEYGFILTLPILATICGFVIWSLIMRYTGNRPYSLVAAYVFSSMIKKNTDSSGATKWLFINVDLSDKEELLRDVFFSLWLLFLAVLSSVLAVFFRLLLLDVSYTCAQNDDTKDCFEYKLWDTKSFTNDPIECNSTATVDVVCYKLVFNPGLALGASYGAFKLSMALIKLAAIGMLKIEQIKILPCNICNVRIILGILYSILLAGVIAVQTSSWRVYFVSDSLTNAVQMFVILLVVCAFVFEVPWKKLMKAKNATYVEVSSMDAV